MFKGAVALGQADREVVVVILVAADHVTVATRSDRCPVGLGDRRPVPAQGGVAAASLGAGTAAALSRTGPLAAVFVFPALQVPTDWGAPAGTAPVGRGGGGGDQTN